MEFEREHAVEFGFSLRPNKKTSEIELVGVIGEDDVTLYVELDVERLDRLISMMSGALEEMRRTVGANEAPVT